MVGDRYFLAHPKVSSLVVVDSAGTPAALTLGTHYTADTDFGALQFLDLGGHTPPFKASYAFGVATEIGIFTQPLPERYLRLEGINTAASNAKVLVELYRVAFDPLKEISFISDDYNVAPAEWLEAAWHVALWRLAGYRNPAGFAGIGRNS